jgi:spore germination protein YaaH
LGGVLRGLVRRPAAWLLAVLTCSCASSQHVRPPTVPALASSPLYSVQEIVQYEQKQALIKAMSHVKLDLAPATQAPAPAPPQVSLSRPLAPHEIFGFAPYWALPIASGFPLADLTTLAYFSLDVNPDGTINTTPADSGFVGYQSQALVDLINRAHAAGDRVVLAVSMFGNEAIGKLVSDPQSPVRFVTDVVPLIKGRSFDGLNIDFEGVGSAIRAGLARFIDTVSDALHAVDPAWQITVDTYASSAQDPFGPFDVSAISAHVDGFFVMAYDMNDPSVPSPTSPLKGGSYNVLEAAAGYLQVVPARKVIVGLPFYGYDWPTDGPQLGAHALGPATAFTYAQIKAAGHPAYWDDATLTPWTSYEDGSAWHQTFYDDPASLTLKAAALNQFGVAGLGIWALGMDGNDPAMIAALLGNAAPVKYQVPPPPASGPPPALTSTQPQPKPPASSSPPGSTTLASGTSGAPTTTAAACSTTTTTSAGQGAGGGSSSTSSGSTGSTTTTTTLYFWWPPGASPGTSTTSTSTTTTQPLPPYSSGGGLPGPAPSTC